MADLKPLIGLAALLAVPEAEVLLTLTPAAAMAAQEFELGYTCVAPPRNTPLSEVDFSPLLSRPTLIWSDSGRTGRTIGDQLASLLPDAVVIPAPDKSPDGWNLSTARNEGWTSARVKTHIATERSRISDELEIIRRGQKPDPVETEQEVNGHDVFKGTTDQQETEDGEYIPPQDDRHEFDNPHYKILGHNRGFFYYLPFSSYQVVALPPAGHVKANFRVLARNEYWKERFMDPANAKGGIPWDAIQSELMDRSLMLPPYNSARIRGRGCWIDDTGPDKSRRVIFHAGDHIIHGSEDIQISVFKSRYVYERGERVKFDRASPATSAEADKVRALCSLLPWQRPLQAQFLAGWCVLAPIAGAIPWRPHIWLTGESGSGKTTVSSTIIDPLLGDFKFFVQSSTTEAGIRNNIKGDAIPILFDESEADSPRGQQRIQAVLELARQASSETGGVIAKGTPDGNGLLFNIRSCFCLSSVGVSATQRADTSRFTILTLEKRSGHSERFKAIKELFRETTRNPAFCAKIRARSMANIDAILHNIESFREAMTIRLGDARTGDQVGTLIAGAFSLTSNRLLSPEDASAWADKQDWSGFTTEDVDRDSVRCFAQLMDAHIIVDGEDRGRETTSYGSLLSAYYDPAEINQENRRDIAATLLLHGIKATNQYVDVSNTHQSIAKVFRDSPWAGKWRDQLIRHPMPENKPKPEAVPSSKFTSGFHRAVRLDCSLWDQAPDPPPEF